MKSPAVGNKVRPAERRRHLPDIPVDTTPSDGSDGAGGDTRTTAALENTYEIPVTSSDLVAARSPYDAGITDVTARRRYDRSLSEVSISDNVLDKDMLRRVKTGNKVCLTALYHCSGQNSVNGQFEMLDQR